MKILILLVLITPGLSQCAFTKVCIEDDCPPPHMLIPPIEPFECELHIDTVYVRRSMDISTVYNQLLQDSHCPEFSDQVLCNDDQDTMLLTQFLLSDFTFGGAVVGRDACAANLKRL
jgi:hypothetical protein